MKPSINILVAVNDRCLFLSNFCSCRTEYLYKYLFEADLKYISVLWMTCLFFDLLFREIYYQATCDSLDTNILSLVSVCNYLTLTSHWHIFHKDTIVEIDFSSHPPIDSRNKLSQNKSTVSVYYTVI